MKTPLVIMCASLLALAGRAAENPVTLSDFKLAGDLGGERAAFTLTATARVEAANGGSLDLLAGPLALTSMDAKTQGHIRAGTNKFTLSFDRRGEFPIAIQFSAAVSQADGWNAVDFHVAPSVLQPIALRGLAANTQFQFAGAARPDRQGAEFVSFLPADGAVKFSWKEARPETEGKLFFSAEMLSQVGVSPGLMRQVALFQCKVMQGELNSISVLLRGEGEVTRVQGDGVLAWRVEGATNSADRRLVIQLNQPQKDQFQFQVQAQTPLGAFPRTVDVFQMRPENAVRFAGYFRIVNDGAVRLEVAQAGGTSQISPEQFPENDATRAAFHAEGNQRFAFRFAGADFALRLRADQILPELAVSHLLAYHSGENELTIDDEIELDIREAPLRELLLQVPAGYAVARLNAPDLNDYSLTEPPGRAGDELRLIFGQPISGRQLVQLRLEHNGALQGTNWTLPRIDVAGAKSARGFVGVSADPGFRITPGRTDGLTEIATAFYPGKAEAIQAAFRLNDAAWEAALRVERLPQTVQAEALHLFSIGEGIAYGSSVLNYVVSGAPVAVFKVGLSGEYFNVEFAGKDIRNWQKTDNGYVVQLHTPVAGAYTLLATYERPFNSQGETLEFTGARPLDAQSEQGYTLITSAYQFQVKRTDVSPGLLELEPGEVPPDYRLFFDAPVLAAYRYAARPFDLKLSLSPLAQGDSLNQIVDRASLETRISKEGQALTDIRYFIKCRGNPHFRLTIPDGAQLWSASINGAPAVPVADGKASLIPLPRSADPNAVLELDLKMASRSKQAGRVTVAAPIADAPVMLASWRIEPDTGQRLFYEDGSLRPAGGTPDVSGFAQLARLLTGQYLGRALRLLCGVLGLAAVALAVWRWTGRDGVWRHSPRHLCGAAAGLLAFGMIVVSFVQLGGLARTAAAYLPADLNFLAPVQQAGSALTIAVSNVADKTSAWTIFGYLWPVLAALALWLWGWFAQSPLLKSATVTGGWTALAWAALRLPNGAPVFFWVLFAFLALGVGAPALRRLWRLPRRTETAPDAPPSGAAPAATTLLLMALLWLGCPNAEARQKVPPSNLPAIPESVAQTVRVENDFALGTAKIRWQAVKGQVLPLLAAPAVLTRVLYPAQRLELTAGAPGSKYAQQLVARENGMFEIEARYEARITNDKTASGFALPVPSGLINQLQLTVVNLDVDVLSPQAVSIQCDQAASNTVASVILPPGEAWIGWRPRSRDVKREKPVFYAETAQLYVPTAGVIEGVHEISIRPAQGQLDELILNVPAGATITDVLDAAARGNGPASLVSLWRFDPDRRQLRVSLNPPQSRPFALVVRSQVATGPLPFAQSVGLLAVDNAAGQIGLAGIATGAEVQLDAADAPALSPINLEDFPGDAAAVLQNQIAGLTLRRAFRYSDTQTSVSLRASAVEPDVRVESEDTLSLGEDRTVLADNFTADITRAGIFDLSFVMPAGFDVESISSPVLSQWTELKGDSGRVITLHLAGKEQGRQQFNVTLAGPGVKTARDWKVPQVVLREAGKQRGTLLIVPEQGMRLQAGAREGYTQLDPQASGIRQKGVLAFRLLQAPANLALDIEQVDPWIEVTSLQHALVTEAQVKVTANLLYQIENTGLKAFRVFLPANAEGVRFQGDQVADFLQLPGAPTNGLQLWEIKLRRRVIGPCLLQAFYQIPMPAQAAATTLRSVQATGVNLQRGFVTVQSDPRLEVAVDRLPRSLQPTEWQSIPPALQKDLQAVAANFTYRLVEPAFELPLKLERHQAAKLLPARVTSISFNSVISDDGVMLTRATLEMQAGDKRLLSLLLPKDARFWFAFVNDSGVWPWRDHENILIPLERQSRGDKPLTVEVFYATRTGAPGARTLDLELLAPKFDLPLENITWRISLSDQWQVKHWTGSLQLQRQEIVSQAAAADPRAYLESENTLQLARTKEAEDFLALGNSSLQNGDPQQARRAFEAAYGLSTHDAAFNEDARVQLHNIKLQEALVGLNARQSAVAGDAGALGAKLRDLRNRKDANYSQQDAKDIIDNNSADDNAAFMRLAEKLIQQQDAAVNNPAVIRASIPEQGRVLTFKRAVAVDPWADLSISLTASPVATASLATRLALLAGAIVVFVVLGLASRLDSRSPA
ncbi:MAG: hypothetical protein ABSG59_02535 [Verrucomicrobiota bacterium]